MFREHAEAQAIDNWPTTDTPLRVALLGWARLSAQAREGSGYNLNASELAAGLVRSGHEVVYVRSGLDYSVFGGMRLRHLERWRGVECYSVINSPNLAPAAANFRNMPSELESPAHSKLVADFLVRERVQVAHVHSLEGFGLDLVRTLKGAGIAVVVTPHNYWYACPQVDLFHKEREVCFDYEGGARCEGCLTGKTTRRERTARRVEQSVERRAGSFAVGLAWHFKRAVDRRLKGMNPKDVPFEGDQAKTDPEAARGFDAAPGERTDLDLGFRLREIEAPKPLGPPGADANERFFSTDVHLKVLPSSVYAARRQAGVRALNDADAVIPPSSFVRRVYEKMGVDDAKTATVRLGQPHFDSIHRRAKRSPYYRARPWDPATATRPLRFAFLGTTRPNKGLEVVVRAIEAIEPDVRARCQFIIRAAGFDWPVRKRLSKFPEVTCLGGFDPVTLPAIGTEYDVGLLPHLWFENSPLVLLEHLHGGKLVIASRLGGPVEWAVEPTRDEPGNVLLFPAGEPDGLARQIERVARGEVMVPSPAEVHATTPHVSDYPSHVLAVERVYRAALAGEAPPWHDGASPVREVAGV